MKARALLIIFFVLFWCGSAFASFSCTVGSSTWTIAFVNYYNCIDDLLADFNSSSSSIIWSHSGEATSDHPVVNDCAGVPDGSRVWIRYPQVYVDYEIYVLNKDASSDSCQQCDDARSALDQQCGEDNYIFDNSTCSGECNDTGDGDLDGDGDGDGDLDGDGNPDDTDPCPLYPNPDCTSGGDDGGDGTGLPNTLDIGECSVDITSLKAWLLGEDSFPFNFFYAIYGIVSPLFVSDPHPPVLQFEIPVDPLGRFPLLPESYPIDVDFTPYEQIAYMIRWAETFLIAWAFAKYGLNRLRSYANSGGSSKDSMI